MGKKNMCIFILVAIATIVAQAVALPGPVKACPGGTCPQPGGSCPGGNCPQPGGSCPGGNCPQPGGSCPGGSCPGGSCPGGSCPAQPGGSCPGGNCPQPGGSCPGGTCPAQPTVYMVGDEKGWVLGVDYQAWADQKTFKNGDILHFIYDRSIHDVYVVNEEEYEKCTFNAPINNVPLCGNNKVPIPHAGATFGFLSGVGQDCQNGLKFKVTVPPE